MAGKVDPDKTYTVTELSPSQLLLIVAGAHLLKHHPKIQEDAVAVAECLDLQEKVIGTPGDDRDLEVSVMTAISEAVMPFEECFMCEGVWDTWNTFNELNRRQADNALQHLTGKGFREFLRERPDGDVPPPEDENIKLL